MIKCGVFILSLFISLSTYGQSVPTCEGQLWGFNIYEVLMSSKIQERFSVFDLQDYSRHSAHQGILVKNGDLKIRVEISYASKSIQNDVYTFTVEKWKHDPQYYSAKNFNPKKVFSNKDMSKITYTLSKDKQTLCRQTQKVLAID